MNTNMNFTEPQLLILVYNLADFGYYGDTEDVKKLVNPMLSVMDGRNDLPIPVSPDQSRSAEAVFIY